MPGLFTNKFPLDGKIKLPVVRVSENERKIWFPPARKSVSTSRSKVIFQKLDFHEQKKAPNKKILFQVDRKLVSTIRNGKFISEHVFLLDEKTAYIDRNIRKIKKIVANSDAKSFQ